jgi:hypothetical protein
MLADIDVLINWRKWLKRKIELFSGHNYNITCHHNWSLYSCHAYVWGSGYKESNWKHLNMLVMPQLHTHTRTHACTHAWSMGVGMGRPEPHIFVMHAVIFLTSMTYSHLNPATLTGSAATPGRLQHFDQCFQGLCLVQLSALPHASIIWFYLNSTPMWCHTPGSPGLGTRLKALTSHVHQVLFAVTRWDHKLRQAYMW